MDNRSEVRDFLVSTANRLGYALYSEAYLDPARPVNIANSTQAPEPLRLEKQDT